MSAPESVAIVAMGASANTYLRLCTVRGDRRKVADETWAINAMGGVIQHDLLFQMDDLAIQEARAKRKPDGTVAATLDWLRQHPRFFTSRAYAAYPGGQEYPLAEVIGTVGSSYFNNTVAYAVAYAIHIGAKRISLYGADFSYPNAHKAERGRGCVEFLMGIAAARGIRIEVAENSTLLDASVPNDQKLYGYDTEDVTIEAKPEGGVAIKRAPKSALSTAEDIEKRYGHE